MGRIMRVLVLEDNARFAKLIQEHLQDDGFIANIVFSVEEFHHMRASSDFDLYLIDLTLPDGDGIVLIKKLRSEKISTPIIIITARARLENRLSGLNAGADDYLVKPFHHKELIARANAVLRRSKDLQPEVLTLGQLSFTQKGGYIACKGKPVDLRPSERRLLLLLIRNFGHTLSRTSIENVLFGSDYNTSPNALDKLVSRLRKALGEHETGLKLRTVKGVGYVLEEQEKQTS